MPTVAFTTALQRFLAAPSAEVEGATVGAALAAVFAARLPARRPGGLAPARRRLCQRPAAVRSPPHERCRGPARRDLRISGAHRRLREGLMTDRIHVGTRKGLFELRRRQGAWEIVGTHFLGDPV